MKKNLLLMGLLLNASTFLTSCDSNTDLGKNEITLGSAKPKVSKADSLRIADNAAAEAILELQEHIDDLENKANPIGDFLEQSAKMIDQDPNAKMYSIITNPNGHKYYLVMQKKEP